MDYAEKGQKGFRGHVFVEIYVKDSWILVNSTSGEYIRMYDPLNPVIPMRDSAKERGYFVLFKGLDPGDYGITSNEQLTDSLRAFAENVRSLNMTYPSYKIERLPGK